MIDEKDLDGKEKFLLSLNYMSTDSAEMTKKIHERMLSIELEMIKLARLGLWAKEHALPAMMKSQPMIKGCGHDDPSWCNETCGDHGKALRKAIQALPLDVLG